MDLEAEIAELIPAAALRPPKPIDIEDLVAWAVSRSGRLPWLRTDPRMLEMNLGLTARPKRRPPTNWTLAEACAGLTLRGRSMPAMMTTGPDAQLVIAAIAALDDAAASGTIVACGRGRIRPDWMSGVVPQRVLRKVYGKKRNGKRRGRALLMPTWVPCSPAEVRAARAIYRAWHKALLVLVERLKPGALAEWTVTGLAAPQAPWEDEEQNNT